MDLDLDDDADKPLDDAAKEAEKMMLQNIERFIQRIRMVSQQIIQDAQKDGEEEDRVISFDPDEDGLEFGIEKAQALHKTINILQFIRKNLAPNNFKHLDAGIEGL